jgi:mono/diheme cytochrome c family protein
MLIRAIGLGLLFTANVHAAHVIYNLPEETATFAEGPGRDVAAANCQTCHSVDYISTQPPRMGKRFWTAEVTKMIKVYGAPISEADAGAIAEYLAMSY